MNDTLTITEDDVTQSLLMENRHKSSTHCLVGTALMRTYPDLTWMVGLSNLFVNPGDNLPIPYPLAEQVLLWCNVCSCVAVRADLKPGEYAFPGLTAYVEKARESK